MKEEDEDEEEKEEEEEEAKTISKSSSCSRPLAYRQHLTHPRIAIAPAN